MKNKFQFTVTVESEISMGEGFALHLAHEVLSAHGVSPSRGVSVNLQIKKNGKIVSENGIDKDGIETKRIRIYK